jgi:hypothetical protein
MHNGFSIFRRWEGVTHNAALGHIWGPINNYPRRSSKVTLSVWQVWGKRSKGRDQTRS